jgi:hypothetical protein
MGGWIIYGFRKAKIAQAKMQKINLMFLTGWMFFLERNHMLRFMIRKICNIFATSFFIVVKTGSFYKDSAKNMDPH